MSQVEPSNINFALNNAGVRIAKRVTLQTYTKTRVTATLSVTRLFLLEQICLTNNSLTCS